MITKLTEQWKAEQRAFTTRDLGCVDSIYLWTDGIHVNIRIEEHELCLLVMIGLCADGRKELIALAVIWNAENLGHARKAFKLIELPRGQAA